MTLETVMNEIHKWYENMTKKYADVIKFEIDKDEKDIHQNYPYLFYDDEKDLVSDIIEQSNRGIKFNFLVQRIKIAVKL